MIAKLKPVIEQKLSTFSLIKQLLRIVICNIVLILIDGLYLISMNHRLRKAVKLAEQASRARTQLLPAMSHDL